MVKRAAWFRGSAWSALLLTAVLGTDLVSSPCMMHGSAAPTVEGPASDTHAHHQAASHSGPASHDSGDDSGGHCDCVGACLTCCSVPAGPEGGLLGSFFGAPSFGPDSLCRPAPLGAEAPLSPLARPPPA